MLEKHTMAITCTTTCGQTAVLCQFLTKKYLTGQSGTLGQANVEDV